MTKDHHLQKAVLAALSWEPSVNSAHIGVIANQGVVTLSGHIDSYAEKHAAENATWSVKGVKAVAEELIVRLPVETERSDEDIAAAAIDRLSWDVSVPRHSAQVTVADGWVTLRGEVDWNFQRSAAEQDVHRLFGVTGITNHMTIKPRANASIISDDITHALNRSWFFDPKTINVAAKGGKVCLTGSVHSPHDRRLAAATAWNSPCVTEVINDITID